MTEETLNLANTVKKTIDRLECEHSRISKMYSKKEELTKEELEDLFQIAMVNTIYTMDRFKDELKSL